MNREAFAHLLRAAADVTRQRDFLVIGSQAILGTYAEQQLPARAVASYELDLAVFDDPGNVHADEIEGALGEGSTFYDTFGVYAQGVGVETATPPEGWQDRLVLYETAATRPGRGYCLEPHDLVLSKMVAGREKDYDYAQALLACGLVRSATLGERIELLPVDERVKHRIREWLRGAGRG